ncbi:hypothetical protein A0H81_12860 [Grifola frondosa]|uniref:BTB domain-containing protein n=1 Tax=Grifola frondosa TaxID=5627 RepID=A0A1C7LW59_GRIFR|nr:hypothetical protein A0H81_12860 [Grifola frondosa]
MSSCMVSHGDPLLPKGSVVVDRPQPVLAISSVLREHAYFASLLSKNFSEGATGGLSGLSGLSSRAEEGEYDYESDSDLDDCEEDKDVDETVLEYDAVPSNGECSSATPTLYSQTGCQEVLIRNVAFRTLRAFVFYLYTNKLNFMPLISEGDEARRVELRRLDADPYAIPSCSPKSMYRFADLCGHTTLQAYAFDAIAARLSPKNIVKESFSRFTSMSPYKKLREHEISVLRQNLSHADVADILPDIIGRTVLGEFPHAGELLLSLLSFLQAKDQSGWETVHPPSWGSTDVSRW